MHYCVTHFDYFVKSKIYTKDTLLHQLFLIKTCNLDYVDLQKKRLYWNDKLNELEQSSGK